MAKIEVTGFVEDVTGNWLIKLTEPHRRKNGDGQWETTARTFRDVKIPKGSELDFSGFSNGDRVTVIGNEITEVRDWRGKKHYTLTVWADSVELLSGSQRPAQATEPQWAADPSADDPWASQVPFPDEEPF